MPINEAGKVIKPDVKMRPREATDHYPTPDALALAALRVLTEDRPRGPLAPSPVRVPPAAFAFYPDLILDPGAGTGPWGRAARQCWPTAQIHGVELTNRPRDPAYSAWWRDDYLTWNPDAAGRYNLILGNPPYKLAEAFIERSLDLLAPGGVLVFLLRLAFLEGKGRYTRLWGTGPLAEVAVCVERPSYTLDGKTDATAYACFYWSKNHPRGNGPRLSWLQWKPARLAPDSAQRGMFPTEEV